MLPVPSTDVYSPDEIALAAGVPPDVASAAMGSTDVLVPFSRAVALGRLLVRQAGEPGLGRSPLFAVFSVNRSPARSRSVPLVVSSTLHLGALAVAVFTATVGLTPSAATIRVDERPGEPLRLVFLATPGPGGGGGGGGLRQKAPIPSALREGQDNMSSPLPMRQTPRPVRTPVLSEPKTTPLTVEPLPPIVAPIAAVPSDARTRTGVLERTTSETDSHGSGAAGGVGTGAGTGIGDGTGPGIGPGSGGGIGGGPYRPGSGITPPRLLREVKPDYTEEARRRGVAGEIVLEIVVRHDGSVGDVKLLRGLGAGLSERAEQAVRQWRFAPAQWQGAAIDVIVEVAVEFKLR